MATRRGREAEHPSPNPRPRRQSRVDAPNNAETNNPATRASTRTSDAQSSTQDAAAAHGPSGPDTMSMQQLLMYITQQQQQYQAQIQAQMQAQMQQANERFEYLVASRGDHKKKDPPVYEGKYGEDIELWIFATEQYYANKRQLMEAESSDFVTIISSNLGKSVLNWYRAFIADCERVNVHKTWSLFKSQLRTRFRPKDFEYDLRERMFHLKQKETIHEYVSKFQDLLSQTELGISELEKRFFFQNGLREETAKKIKEESPGTLQEAIEIASNFEFAHYSGKPPRTPSKQPNGKEASSSRPFKPKQQPVKRFEKKGKKDDWTKTAKCNNCGEVGHISPQCKKPKNNESNRYMSGSVYAILEVEAQAYKNEDQQTNVSIFIDNGSSLNGVTEELVKKPELEVTEHEMMQVDLGYDQIVHRSRRTVEMSLAIPGFPVYSKTFQVMPVPEEKDIVLGMVWLREQNPDVNWETLQIKPRNQTASPIRVKVCSPTRRPAKWIAGRRRTRVDQNREIFNYYRHHGHQGRHGPTRIISSTQFRQILRKDKDIEAVFMINPHDSEKAERFKSQGWEALKDNPAYPILRKYADTVFRTELPSETPPIREGIEHEILLKPGTKPISVKQWRQSPDQRQIIQDWTKEMVQAGIIRPSTSAFSAPTFCVKKPVGWRIVHDFRQLNLATILPVIPMPRKEDTFDAMAGSFWYSCMDLLWGYYQVKLRESDIPFTAFSTPDGLFEYFVTPMGLSGSPGTFNRLLQKVFRDLRDVMRIYFDDIYVFTANEDVSEHLEALDRVLKRCEEQKLYIKLSKCQFCVDEIPCLGDFVGRNGVRMDPDKVKIIADWPVPKTKKQMESFLGTTVYVSRFCKDFAQFAGPLHDSIKGKRSRERIQLTKDQLRCFEGLKHRLSSPPVLKLSDFSKPFGIRMDASNFAIGGVLFQNEGGLEHPIAFTGRKMKPAELNYPVREQELLAIMHALKTWRVYLLDKPFTVETDHKSIEMILTQKTTNRRIARWFNELAEFQPLFKWIPGETNTVADALSRKPDFEHKAAQVSLKELLESAQNREIVATVVASKMTVAQSAKQMYSWKKELLWIIKRLKAGDKIPRYSINDDVLYYQTREDEAPRLYIPNDEDLKNRVICENHDAVSAGHPGYYKTYLAVREKYYWPRMSKYIQRYVNTCEMCQRNKARQTKPPGLLQSLDVPKGRWVDISMDFIVSLPPTKDGFNSIMVIVDRLTKRAKFIATKTTDDSNEIANVFMKNYVKDHGMPKTIVSDRDTKFTSKFWQATMTAMETQHNLSSAFRPQTDGQTERTNRFIGDYLRGVISPAQNDWDEYLHLAEIAYNRRVHSTIGMSPFEADLGYIPFMPDDVAIDPEFKKLEKSAQEFLLRQQTLLKVAQDRMSEAQERMKHYYDLNRHVQNFEVNDMVLLDGKNMDIRHKGYTQSKKLAPRYIGPFPVLKKISKDSYELGLSKGLKMHPVFHTSLLKPYQKDINRKQKVNKVVLADGSEGQLVEAVIGHRKYKGKPQYKIWWLGESKSEATWEPVENLKQIPGLIDLYWGSKKKPKPFSK